MVCIWWLARVKSCCTLWSMDHVCIAGSSLQLSPADVRINEAESAVFNCTFECSIRDSHTIVWLVGDLPLIQRYFVMGRTRTFSSQSDLQVQVSDLSTCTSAGEGRGVQQLQIQVTSATLHNRTAVQCHAARKHTDYSDLYSMYGLVLVDHNIGETHARMHAHMHTHTHAHTLHVHMS